MAHQTTDIRDRLLGVEEIVNDAGERIGMFRVHLGFRSGSGPAMKCVTVEAISAGDLLSFHAFQHEVLCSTGRVFTARLSARMAWDFVVREAIERTRAMPPYPARGEPCDAAAARIWGQAMRESDDNGLFGVPGPPADALVAYCRARARLDSAFNELQQACGSVPPVDPVG